MPASAKSRPSHCAFFRIGRRPMISGKSSSRSDEGEADRALADRLPTSRPSPRIRGSGGGPGCRASRRTRCTSSTVTGLPSENCASGWRVNSTQDRSSGDLDRFGQKSVKREGFVPAAAHQALGRKPSADCQGALPFRMCGLRRIEASDLALNDHLPALGRVRIGIGERHKIGWQGRVAIHSYAVLWFGAAAEAARTSARAAPTRQRFARKTSCSFAR